MSGDIHSILEVCSHGNCFTAFRVINAGLVLGDGEVRVHPNSSHLILLPNGTSISFVALQVHCNVTCIECVWMRWGNVRVERQIEKKKYKVVPCCLPGMPLIRRMRSTTLANVSPS